MTRMSRAAVVAALAMSLAVPAGLAGTAVAQPASASGSTAPAVPTTAPRLPEPTGKHGVGSSVLHLVDRSRTDPWVPTADGRELLVTMHYPTARSAKGAPARYATVEEAKAMVDGFAPGVPAGQVSRMRTHGKVNAPISKGRYPLVVLSPGFSGSRFTQTNLAEDLASRGFVVASVDHAYESFGTSMPDGRFLTCVACTALDRDGVPPSVVTRTRAKDVSFLLDRLTGAEPAWRHSGSIDRKRIGMVGHSIGGAAAASAMVADRRVRAGVNMDGAFWEALPPQGVDGRPFLLLGTDDEVHRPGGADRTWDETWPGLNGWKRWLTVAGTNHLSFSDVPVLNEHYALPGREPMTAARTTGITRTYVAAFLDRHLSGRPRPVLAGPTAGNPEVKFHHLNR
ncbi:alpha/beta hydrolase family protein [Streptomyces sp. LE64]|uniref:alpha/beta hydrolase family protein n=1 Tax=Streptomyces sp. LE64 TaxID=3448653 RepID=UPI0040431231